MSGEIKNEVLLSDLMNLFNPLKVEQTPNQPIANANDRLNEPLIRQIADDIQQQIAALSGTTQVFADDAQLLRLITSTGGHKKTLYILLHDTFLHSQGGFPVSLRAIGIARGNLKDTMNRSVDANKWSLLAKVHRYPYGNYFELPEHKVLPIWSILRYEDPDAEWYRVHPLLVETSNFKEALEVFVK
jgi:hypothetical protein